MKIVSLGPAWITQQDPVSKNKTQNETKGMKDSLLVHHHTQVTTIIYSHSYNQNRKHFKII
jgi:hypothetical protein